MAAFDVEDIVFREIEGRALAGRLYRPQAESFPLLIDVHGGAWTSGDRKNNAVIHEALAVRGIGVFAIDFRMPPEARYPAALQDVNYAIRWLKRNAEKLGSRPELVGGIGTSSGAHLLVLNTLLPEDARWRSGGPDIPGAALPLVIACWPILDPLARLRMARQRNLANLLTAHADFWPDEQAMALANPQAVVDRAEHSERPRLLILQGTSDANVEPERARLFADAYRAAGGVVDLQVFEGEPHAFMLIKPAPGFARALELMVSFVRTPTA